MREARILRTIFVDVSLSRRLTASAFWCAVFTFFDGVMLPAAKSC